MRRIRMDDVDYNRLLSYDYDNLPGCRSVDQLDQTVHHRRRVATAYLGERERGSLVVWDVRRH